MHQTRRPFTTGAGEAGFALAVGLAFLSLLVGKPARAAEVDDLDDALRLARDYLDCDDPDRRGDLAGPLAEHDGQIGAVVARLAERRYEPVEPGYHPAEHFRDPGLREAYPDDLLYFTVPRSYRPDRPGGLIVFLHGGGRTSSRRAPRYFMNFPDDEDDDSSQLGDLFDGTGMVAVGPSAPWDEESAYRWCLPEADDYLAAVIRESSLRFHIDPDRVFLVGHSMGGFGAYHHIQRQPDRFAAVVSNAGSWSLAHWPATRGTRLCIIHGTHDAQRGQRWHYTDIEFARWTDKLLSRLELDYVYLEHDGEHGMAAGRPHLARFFESTADLRRDPCAPHVVLASPVGFRSWYCFPVEHNRWLTLDEAAEGELTYDRLVENDADDFDEWRLTYRREWRPGASIEARLQGRNTITVTTCNVARFTIWLRPEMVDLERKVRIVVDGTCRFRGRVKPSLATALDSYRRRGDWGLIYPARVEIDLTRSPDRDSPDRKQSTP